MRRDSGDAAVARLIAHPADTLADVSRTFIICKPDAVERGLVGTILQRFEAKGLKVVAAELRQLDAGTLAEHYAEHVGKGFYDDLVGFMSRSPAFVAVLEGPKTPSPSFAR